MAMQKIIDWAENEISKVERFTLKPMTQEEHYELGKVDALLEIIAKAKELKNEN